MYVNYNAKTAGVQYNYAETRQSTGKNTKTIDVRVDYQSISVSAHGVDSAEINSAGLNSAAEKMSAGYKQSVSEILDKIKEHTAKNYERQSETVLAEIKSFSMSIRISITSESDTEQAAKELTSENGYFGVKKTSERIFNFAAGIAGSDIDRLKQAKEGIEKGFDKVKGIFGSALPDITEKTHDAVIEKIENYIYELEKSAEKAYA